MALYKPDITEGSILDIGGSQLRATLRDLLTESLNPSDQNGTPLLHSALMWDDAGLAMWRQLTDLPCYNQMWDEMELMEKHIDQIAQTFADETVIVDLGSGYVQLILGEERRLLML